VSSPIVAVLGEKTPVRSPWEFAQRAPRRRQCATIDSHDFEKTTIELDPKNVAERGRSACHRSMLLLQSITPSCVPTLDRSCSLVSRSMTVLGKKAAGRFWKRTMRSVVTGQPQRAACVIRSETGSCSSIT
jgi:hypothetical protein